MFLFPAYFGMSRAGYGRQIWGHVVFMVFFFTFWEIRILCRHCPYYAEKGWTLRCNANFGCPKIWQYAPGPMNSFEKVQLLIGFVILFGYPLPFMIYGGQKTFAFLTAWAILVFWWTMKKHTCSNCVNFSCPLNGVPKKTIDEYLRRNPVMREAWEKAGWRLSDED